VVSAAESQTRTQVPETAAKLKKSVGYKDAGSRNGDSCKGFLIDRWEKKEKVDNRSTQENRRHYKPLPILSRWAII